MPAQPPGKIGYQVVKNIQDGGYEGTIVPINPKGGEVLGLESYKSLEDFPGDIDLATMVIPAKFVLDSVKACAKKGVKFLSIITSGFSEVGNVRRRGNWRSYASPMKTACGFSVPTSLACTAAASA